VPTSDFTPSLTDVGGLIPTRTRDANGSEVGTFNLTTRPTSAQVAALIASSVTRVAGLASADLPVSLQPQASYLSALHTAMWIELTFYPEQISNEMSPYTRMKELWDEAIAQFKADAEAAGVIVPVVDAGAGEGIPLKPVANFALDPSRYLIGRGTWW
jgi:hypothetical protein